MLTITITDPELAKELEADPFALGWRYVPRPLPNGDQFLEQTPLTLEDILHPQVGDYRMHSQDHERFCNYLLDVFAACVQEDSTAVVFHDVRCLLYTSPSPRDPE